MRTEHNEAAALQPMHRLLFAIRWAVIVFVFVDAWKVVFTSTLVQRVPVMVSMAIIAVIGLAFQVSARRTAPQDRQPLSPG